MKKVIVLILALLMLGTTLASCGGDATWTGVLYADLSQGASDAASVKDYPFEYTGKELTPEILAAELSTLMGLDYKITAQKCDDGYIIDWAADSTLIAGLDDREQKEEFFCFDISSLRWMMMDSLYATLKGNFEVENIYYTMDGGKTLEFADKEIYPQTAAIFPSDIPYMGSPFYFAHAQEVTVDDSVAVG